MGLMMLAASKGTTIEVKMSGKDAKKAMEAIKTLVKNKFNEE
jgi:phosphocarrier protein